MAHTWQTPAGEARRYFLEILKENHILIAGATGSGKSVLIHNLIYHILFKFPDGANGARLVLIDPKRVTLGKYKRLPHCLRYASEPESIRAAISSTINIMERRYRQMQKRGEEKNTRDPHIYVIIDEYADLMTTDKKTLKPQILRIAQLGRAANIHLIIATQRPTADIIDGAIKVNVDWRIALKVPTARDSQNVIGIAGAEALPRYGFGIVREPCGDFVRVEIPLLSDEDISARIDWWERQTPEAEKRRRRYNDFLDALSIWLDRIDDKKKKRK